MAQPPAVFWFFGFVTAPFDFPSPARMRPASAEALARRAVRGFQTGAGAEASPKIRAGRATKIPAAHRDIFSVNALGVPIQIKDFLPPRAPRHPTGLGWKPFATFVSAAGRQARGRGPRSARSLPPDKAGSGDGRRGATVPTLFVAKARTAQRDRPYLVCCQSQDGAARGQLWSRAGGSVLRWFGASVVRCFGGPVLRWAGTKTLPPARPTFVSG